MAIATEVTTKLPEWCTDWSKQIEGKRYLSDQDKMTLVLELLEIQIKKNSGGPFAAAIFDQDGEVVSIGVNQVVPGNNSVAHAEMVAFQLAEQNLETFSLSNKGKFTLVTSAQQCAQCYGAAPWAGISEVIYAATATDTEVLLGFDEGPIHENWIEEYKNRGIIVKGEILRDKACELMSQYSGKIYNGKILDKSMNTDIVGNEAGRIYVQKMHEAAEEIRQRIQIVPKTLVILGSGLGGFVDALDEVKAVVPYREIPHFPHTSTDGHAGNLVIGSIEGTDVAVFQGRVHCHDGYTPQEVTFGVRTMALLGVENIIITNAAGGIRAGYQVGDLMVIKNHISLFLPEDPSQGLVHPVLGQKFYPQTYPYDKDLIEKFVEIAEANQIRFQKGVYVFAPGPRYESAADVVALQALGADAAGMSTVPEALAIADMNSSELKTNNIRVLGISIITNLAAGLTEEEPNHEEVKAAGDAVGPKLQKIVTKLLSDLN